MTPGRSVWLRRWTARETDREAYRGGAVCGLSARRFSHSPPGVGVFLFPTRAAGCMQTCRRFVLHRHNSPTGPVHTLDTCPDTCIPTHPCTRLYILYVCGGVVLSRVHAWTWTGGGRPLRLLLLSSCGRSSQASFCPDAEASNLILLFFFLLSVSSR